ncbi:MAG: ribosomal protein S18-alanine N-acetyltransferase [Thioalkalispiraceae bacterium]|jgi:ribosomal-protein-alanine N-acetyltransferase
MSAVLKAIDGIRPMTEEDLAQVLAIERATYRFPWTLGIFHDCLHVGYCCWVYEQNDEIEAYAVMSVGADEAHILTIVVKEGSRGQGIGRMILSFLKDIAVQHKADTLLLEVRPTNEIAVNLYRSFGFNDLAIRPNYYPSENGREDALIMAMSI